MSEQPSRFSQAQVLIAALFAVVLTGEMPMEQVPTNIEQLRKQCRRRPNFSKIARDLGVSPAAVAMVFRGTRTSKRISLAIEKHIRAERQGGAL